MFRFARVNDSEPKKCEENSFPDSLLHLEKGLILNKLGVKDKYVKRVFRLQLVIFAITWEKLDEWNVIEGLIDIRNIKEIRFEGIIKKSVRNCVKHIRIFYGKKFKLNELSVYGSVTLIDHLINGIQYLQKHISGVPYDSLVDVMLKREFYELSRISPFNSVSIASVSLNEIRIFIEKLGLRMKNNEMKAKFSIIDEDSPGKLNFEGFKKFYENLIKIKFDKFLEEIYGQNLKDRVFIALGELDQFYNNRQLSNGIRLEQWFLDNISRTKTNQPKYLYTSEFIEYLYSKSNSLFDPKYNTVYQNMNRPLSHYFIATSHNTYLSGDQVKSESSVECYARCLRIGCRCIELDCWDGADGRPVIYHGMTLTSKLRFIDVIRTIRDHAFATSEYPVILSIENHCSVKQQQYMAKVFKDIFGTKLLRSPIDHSEESLPSPNQLKGKIILKHKKIKFLDHNILGVPIMDSTEIYLDKNDAFKIGTLYLDKESEYGTTLIKNLKPYHFLLYPDKLYCAENLQEQNNNQQKILTPVNENVENTLHEEIWFHGRLKGGRSKAEFILQRFKSVHHLNRNVFLVRESETIKGDYVLSVYHQEQCTHFRIKIKEEKDGVKNYTLTGKIFPSIKELIDHYTKHPFNGPKSQIIQLLRAVPRQLKMKACCDYYPEIIENRLTFSTGDIIINVVKWNENLYIGDLGNQRGLFFSPKYVREIDDQDIISLDTNSNYQVIRLDPDKINFIPKSEKSERGHFFRLGTLEIYAKSEQDSWDWMKNIQAVLGMTRIKIIQNAKLNEKFKIAPELDELIIYCKSVPFSGEFTCFAEMSSFNEVKMEKLINAENCRKILQYNTKQLSRVYPNGTRLNSSNYDPIKFWNCGTQMVALNYQTPDRAMQLNHAMFLQNGNCGYVLKPKIMFSGDYNPYERSRIHLYYQPIILKVRIIGARHLGYNVKFRERDHDFCLQFRIDIIGVDQDCQKHYTDQYFTKDLNMVCLDYKTYHFPIYCPELAFIRFRAFNTNVYIHEELDLCGQSILPISCLRPGYRSIQLKNEFNEELELSTLLVHIRKIKKLFN